MTALIPPTGRVHWLGTGLSSGSGLGLLAEHTTTTLWGRTGDRAKAKLSELGLDGDLEPRGLEEDSLVDELTEGDLVISMLPVSEHARILQLATEHRAHFACSSYLSAEVAALARGAAERGQVVLTEVGLDPGIDHLLAHEIVEAARAAVGDGPATARFTSYCGSNPAVPNEFRYQFSWAPIGVLKALLTPARFVADSEVVTIRYPWQAVTESTVDGERFEAYPNRDSVPFIETYRIPDAWTLETFVRGTLRLAGWSDAWRPVFDVLPTASEDTVAELAGDLLRRHPTSSDDRDRVLMAVALELETAAGERWSGLCTLDALGTADETATSRLVSVPLACAGLDLVGGQQPPGLHQGAHDHATVRRWLAWLAEHGVSVTVRTSPS